MISALGNIYWLLLVGSPLPNQCICQYPRSTNYIQSIAGRAKVRTLVTKKTHRQTHNPTLDFIFEVNNNKLKPETETENSEKSVKHMRSR